MSAALSGSIGHSASATPLPSTNPISRDFTVHVSNLFVPNYDIYLLWLSGFTGTSSLVIPGKFQWRVVDQAIVRLKSSGRSTNVHFRKFILNQYRDYEMLEHYFHRPPFFYSDQHLFPLPTSVKTNMIELYYGFDEPVIRELLGKKLNYRTRKDLDDVCEKTNISLGSCRRQFDNLKRVTKRLDDVPQDCIADTIQQTFLLPRRLACQFAHIIFINEHRLDTSKRKLSSYTFADFEYCASVFMRYWLNPTREAFDSQLAQDIRDLRNFLHQNKDVMEEFRLRTAQFISEAAPPASAILSANPNSSPSFGMMFLQSLMDASTSVQQSAAAGTNLSQQSSTTGTTAALPAATGGMSPLGAQGSSASMTSIPNMALGRDFSSQFKVLVRNVMQIGCGLNNAKEVRDIFLTLIEKVMEPCVSFGWRSPDCVSFLTAVRECWPKLNGVPTVVQRSLYVSWYRLTMGLQLAAVRFFNDHRWEADAI